jgi:maltokinase
VTVLDVLDLGHDSSGRQAIVAVVRVDGRDVIAPGHVASGQFRRDPSVASLLRAGEHGAFVVELPGAGIPSREAVMLDVDQSNDSVLLGDVMVKWQLDAAPSPAPDRLRVLAGSDAIPAVRAIVTWQRSDGTRCTVMTAADALPDSDDGWTWAVDLVRAHARGDDGDAITPFARIGAMTASMHVSLAGSGISTWEAADLERLQEECTVSLAEAAGSVEGAEGDRLRSRRARLQEVIDRLGDIDATPAIDIHGDFHVGQIIEAGQGEFLIVDFDGSPAQPPAERLAKQPAARDVAGMLASIDHVARVVNHRTEGLDPRPALIWIAHAQEAFLAEYQAVLVQHGLRRILDDRLISPFLLQQEMREYIYAARHLPHWRYVPDAVITSEFPDALTQRSDT